MKRGVESGKGGCAGWKEIRLFIRERGNGHLGTNPQHLFKTVWTDFMCKKLLLSVCGKGQTPTIGDGFNFLESLQE